jgi:hypothetical protein
MLLDQQDYLAAGTHNLDAALKELRATLWAVGWHEDASGEFERAHALDEAVTFVLVRLPADVVVKSQLARSTIAS